MCHLFLLFYVNWFKLIDYSQQILRKTKKFVFDAGSCHCVWVTRFCCSPLSVLNDWRSPCCLAYGCISLVSSSAAANNWVECSFASVPVEYDLNIAKAACGLITKAWSVSVSGTQIVFIFNEFCLLSSKMQLIFLIFLQLYFWHWYCLLGAFAVLNWETQPVSSMSCSLLPTFL